jgi:hypothetical protein
MPKSRNEAICLYDFCVNLERALGFCLRPGSGIPWASASLLCAAPLQKVTLNEPADWTEQSCWNGTRATDNDTLFNDMFFYSLLHFFRA